MVADEVSVENGDTGGHVVKPVIISIDTVVLVVQLSSLVMSHCRIR